MPKSPRRIEDPEIAQRAIVHQMLDEEHPQRWTRAELEQTLHDVTPQAVSDAITGLEASGVLYRLDDYLGIPPNIRSLDALGLIAI